MLLLCVRASQLLFLNKNTLWQRKKTNRINYFNLIICIWLAIVRLPHIAALQKHRPNSPRTVKWILKQNRSTIKCTFNVNSEWIFVLAYFSCISLALSIFFRFLSNLNKTIANKWRKTWLYGVNRPLTHRLLSLPGNQKVDDPQQTTTVPARKLHYFWHQFEYITKSLNYLVFVFFVRFLKLMLRFLTKSWPTLFVRIEKKCRRMGEKRRV